MTSRHIPNNPNGPPNGDTHHIRSRLRGWLHLHDVLNKDHYGLTTEIRDIHGKHHDLEVADIALVAVPDDNERRRHFHLHNGTIIVATLAASIAAIEGIHMYLKHHK